MACRLASDSLVNYKTTMKAVLGWVRALFAEDFEIVKAFCDAPLADEIEEELRRRGNF